MHRTKTLAGIILSIACASYGADTLRVVPSADSYMGTLGGSSTPPRTLSGQGTLTTSPLPGGSLLGRDAVRASIDSGTTASEFWLLAELPLQPDVQRVSFWAFSRGIAWSETRAVLQDPQGVIRAYKAQAVGDSPWTLYHINVVSPGEPLFELERTTGDGHWHFRGLVLRYQPFAKGGITLGEILTSTIAAPAGMPQNSWSFRDIDETLIHQGAYTGFRFSYEATTLPVRIPLGLLISPARSARDLEWQLRSQDGSPIDSGKVRIGETDGPGPAGLDFLLPTLPAGNYTFRAKLRGGNGELLHDYESSYLLHRSTATSTPVTQSNTTFDHFWPSAAVVDVDVASSSPKSIVVPTRGTQADDRVEWTWSDSTSTPIGRGTTILTDRDGELTIPPPAETLSGPQRYQVHLRLLRGDRLVDQRTANVFANAGRAPFVQGTAGPVRYFTLKETDMRSIRADQQPSGSDFIRNAASNGSDAFLMFFWDEIEPRKGFVQFVPMDRRIAEAAKAGVGVIPTLSVHLDRLPRWLWYPVMLDQGLQSRHYNSSFTRKPSPASKEVRDALAETARAIVRHYKDSPAILGWNFTQGVESFWSDASRNGFVVDFSPTASKAFGAYLETTGWSLDQVSGALGRHVAAWDDVTPPMPTFSPELDLRPLWLAWEDFKQKVPSENFDSLLAAVRSEDPKRPIFVYAGMGAGDLVTYTEPFVRHHGTICFGGGDAAISPFLESLALGAGVDFDAESAAVPPFEPQLLTTIFHKLSHGSTRGGTNIMWGRFFSAASADHVNGSRTAAKWVNVIDRIGPSKPVWAEVAVGVGSRSIINRTRSFMWIDWMNLPKQSYHFANMIGQTVGGNAQVGYVTDNTPLEQLQAFPVIVFLEAPLLADAAAERLNQYVRGGGTLVLQGETGIYNERGQPTALLRTLLGVEPDGQIRTVGKGRVRWVQDVNIWQTPDALEGLAGDLGYKKPTKVSRTDVRHALRKSEDGKSQFLILFRKTWPTGNPRLQQLSGKEELVQASIHTLPPGAAWRLTNLVDNASLGEQTSEELAQGIELQMKPADMVIIRLDPK